MSPARPAVGADFRQVEIQLACQNPSRSWAGLDIGQQVHVRGLDPGALERDPGGGDPALPPLPRLRCGHPPPRQAGPRNQVQAAHRRGRGQDQRSGVAPSPGGQSCLPQQPARIQPLCPGQFFAQAPGFGRAWAAAFPGCAARQPQLDVAGQDRLGRQVHGLLAPQQSTPDRDHRDAGDLNAGGFTRPGIARPVDRFEPVQADPGGLDGFRDRGEAVPSPRSGPGRRRKPRTCYCFMAFRKSASSP